MHRHIVGPALVLLLVVGCGGGGGGDAGVANVAPAANAGVAQNVTTGTLVTLNGSASSDANSDSLTYLWTLTSKPVPARLHWLEPLRPRRPSPPMLQERMSHPGGQ